MSKKRNEKRHGPSQGMNVKPLIPDQNIREIAARVHELQSQDARSRTRVTQVAVPPTFVAALINIATNAWRTKRKMVNAETGEAKEEMKRVYRHIEAMFEALKEIDFRIDDPEGRAYDSGMALKVVTFEPTIGIAKEQIKETIKPSVFYKDQLLQMGEVIVGTPQI